MTIEEKREAIEDFCDSSVCVGCPLLFSKCGSELVYDSDVDVAYALVFGQDAELKDEIADLKEQLKTARVDAVMRFAEKLTARMFEAEYRVPDLSRFDVEEALNETLAEMKEKT